MKIERLAFAVLATYALSLNTALACSDGYEAPMSSRIDQTMAESFWPASSGTTAKKLDLALPEEGSEIFLGETEISNSVISEKLRANQARTLYRMGKKLPKMTMMLLNMKDFEGRLDKDQFKALRYYLNVRYATSGQYYVSK